MGSRAREAESTVPRRLCGLEAIDHALDLQLGFARLRSQVQALCDLPIGFEPAERQFMQELREALAELVNDDALFGEGALLERTAAPLSALGQAPQAAIEAEVRDYLKQRRRAYARPRLSHLELQRSPLSLLRSEPTVSQALWLPNGSYDAAEWQDAHDLQALFTSIESCIDPEQALLRVAQAEREIRSRWG